MFKQSCVFVMALFAMSDASQYDPHVRRGQPWFEGWYSRISETSTGDSIGVICGYFPDQAKDLRDPMAYAALIVDRGHGSGKPLVFERFPTDVRVRVNGDQPVHVDPDFPSSPEFSYVEPDGSFDMRQNGDNQHVFVRFEDATHGRVTLEANFSKPVAWGPQGESPEGWAGKLPVLGLHWFVFSLGSAAKYRIEIGSEVIHGQGVAHQEKNWGTSFPKSWIWAEATLKGTRVALAGGPAPVGPITIPNAYLLGYRSQKLDWSFHPQDPALYSPTIDACKGVFEVEAKAPGRRLVVRFEADTAPGAGFFDVAGPTPTGFREDSVESYRAKVTVRAYTGLLLNNLEEEVTIDMGAIEFGGDYRCKGGRLLSARNSTTVAVY